VKARIREEVSVGGRPFVFTLCRKEERLGDVPVDHWWMRATEVYGQRAHRGRGPGNHEALADAFWALCRREGSHTEADVRESYLLARLLPHVRSQGSRRVVADAFLTPGTQAAKKAQRLPPASWTNS